MITYQIGNKAYINLTNKCSNACDFCVRNDAESYEGYALWLKQEPNFDEICEAIKKYEDLQEFVFCGFGEPLYRVDMIIKVGRYLKAKNKTVRLNTNGQADLIAGKDVAKRLKGAVDIVSISLNETDAESYQKICHCEFGADGYNSMLRFVTDCKNQGLRVILSIVDILGAEKTKKAQQIASDYGVELRIRTLIQ